MTDSLSLLAPAEAARGGRRARTVGSLSLPR
jgi:hypothetical protein